MQTIGLQATFDLSGWTANYNTYIANVLKASQTTTSSAAAMGASATRMGATWDAVASRWRNTVTGRFTDGAGEASRSLTGLGSVSQSASVHVNTLGLMGTAAAHALGNILAQGAQAAMQSLMNLGAVGLESVAHFEGLIMSSRAMTAQQLMNADATLSMEDALAQAGPIAAQLAHWQERLAILSPFGQKDVEAVFNLAQAYQLNNDQAARMTLGVVNFGAAVHASGPMLERMALALGQVNTAGRLTGMELRQLTEARVPVLGILSKALNKTTAEIKQMVSDGLVPSDVALNAIMEHFEKYGNAAADQANSFGGLMASLADLGPMLTRNLLGPIDDMGKVGGILGALQPHLAELVSTLSSDSFNEGLAGMSNTVAVYAENAFSWGENIVNQLANGMYAAMSAVFDALANIGNYSLKGLIQQKTRVIF
jgi:tape measure domain-containing protein